MTIWLCFDHHAQDGHVWAIREGNTWHRAKAIDCRIPLETVYRGPKAQQPRAYLKGSGRVTLKKGMAVIASSPVVAE